MYGERIKAVHCECRDLSRCSFGGTMSKHAPRSARFTPLTLCCCARTALVSCMPPVSVCLQCHSMPHRAVHNVPCHAMHNVPCHAMHVVHRGLLAAAVRPISMQQQQQHRHRHQQVLPLLRRATCGCCPAHACCRTRTRQRGEGKTLSSLRRRHRQWVSGGMRGGWSRWMSGE